MDRVNLFSESVVERGFSSDVPGTQALTQSRLAVLSDVVHEGSHNSDIAQEAGVSNREQRSQQYVSIATVVGCVLADVG